jgi:hypothetical protein
MDFIIKTTSEFGRHSPRNSDFLFPMNVWMSVFIYVYVYTYLAILVSYSTEHLSEEQLK